MLTTKYIIFRTEFGLLPIGFPECVSHESVHTGMSTSKPAWKAWSAGRYTLSPEGKVACHRSASSIQVESKPGDEKIIQHHLFPSEAIHHKPLTALLQPLHQDNFAISTAQQKG